MLREEKSKKELHSVTVTIVGNDNPLVPKTDKRQKILMRKLSLDQACAHSC
jgi:hypothetical protein